MIVEDIISFMETLDNELDAVSGGSDETRAIAAINFAIRYCETVAASMPKVLSRRGDETIKTSQNVESTPVPAELLRIDKLFALDPTTKQPLFPMQAIRETGGHTPALPWPLNFVANPSTGQPRGYYVDTDHFFWLPIPDNTYEIRAYGVWQTPTLGSGGPEVDRKSPFLLPSVLALPIAAFATKYMDLAVGDDTDAVQKIAVETFSPALRTLKKRDRSAPQSRSYAYTHTT